MRRTTLRVMLLWFLVGYSVSAPPNRAAEADCPVVYVDCPNSCESEDEPCVFTAVVKGAEPGRKLTYAWEVSKGKIKSGQGTETITVDMSGLSKDQRTGVTGAVEIGGIDKKCSNAVSCATGIY